MSPEQVTTGGWLTAQPSSGVPLQFSSRPFPQISGTAVTPPVHEPQVPPVQVWLPNSHSPTSVPHGMVAPVVQVQPSSTGPSQSLSRPSQNDGASLGPGVAG